MNLLKNTAKMKSNDEEINLSLEQLKAVLFNHPEIIYVTDPETYEVIFMNKCFVDLIGKNAEGEKCYKAFQGLDKPCSFCTNDVLFKSKGKMHTWEHHNKLVDKHFYITDQLIDWPDGRKVRFEIATDITEKKKHELELLKINQEFSSLNEEYLALNEELKSSNEKLLTLNNKLKNKNLELDETFAKLSETKQKFQSILDNSIDCLWQLDRRLHFTFISPSSEIILGYKAEDMLNKPLWKFAKRKEFIKMARKALKSILYPLKHPITIFETYMTHKEGYEVPVEIVGKTMFDNNKKLTGVHGSTRDITDRISIQDQLKKVNEELEQKVLERTRDLVDKNKELTEFTYTVSHDLKAPLRAIKAYAEALHEDYYEKLENEAKIYLTAIIKSTNKTRNLVDELLNLSRLNTKEIVKQKIDMNSLFGDVMKTYTDAEPERMINWKVLQNMPSVYADKTLMEQVVTNLIDNALKYSSKNKLTEINIGWYSEDDENVYYVKDNGVGFNMKYQNKLFTLFDRLHHQKDFPGVGAGLAIVKKILDKHKGRIWADSKNGEGAAFYFSLTDLN